MPRPPRDSIVAEVHARVEVKRSRFLATLAPVVDVAAAEAVVAAARARYHDARHHCSAWVLGPDGARTRASDDGEPSGTAGAPMLAVLEGAELTDVVAVVTRYFGGTLLGAGGLVRAYGDAVGAALAVATRVRRRSVRLLEVRTTHTDAGRLEHLLHTSAARLGGAVGDGRTTAAGASYDVAVPDEAAPQLHAALAASGIAHEVEDRGRDLRPR